MRPEDNYHTSVLSAEMLALLKPRAGETFVDGTLGGGGHTQALLDAGAHVIGLDQDPDAIEFSKERLHRYGDSFHPVRANFAEIGTVLDQLHVAQIDGALLDLGVSSWQLDAPERGFSFQTEGPLDMRMNPDAGITAADLVNTASAEDLADLFYRYGEEAAARRIAAHLVRVREQHPFRTTLDLARAVESVIPRHGRTHPATRVFQALRIAVNREMEVLASALAAFSARLRPGGRFGVVTFHSLEDRMVKEFFKLRCQPTLDRPEWPEPRPNPDFQFHAVTRKPVTAGDSELAANPRSRSAKLRVVEKIRS